MFGITAIIYVMAVGANQMAILGYHTAILNLSFTTPPMSNIQKYSV